MRNENLYKVQELSQSASKIVAKAEKGLDQPFVESWHHWKYVDIIAANWHYTFNFLSYYYFIFILFWVYASCKVKIYVAIGI